MIVARNGPYLAKTGHDHESGSGSVPKLAMIVEGGGGR